ncbi:hypothetical protein ACFLR9_08250 [Bacteroidota bacterium]
MVYHNLIHGENFTDKRGTLNFFNAFDMTAVVRFYEITPNDTNTIRAWQGHKDEKKWFYCIAGAFGVNLIKLDNFDNPSNLLKSKNYILKENDPCVLEISGGFATGFKALEKNSKLLVFSNFNLEESKNDDFRYPIDKWEAKW